LAKHPTDLIRFGDPSAAACRDHQALSAPAGLVSEVPLQGVVVELVEATFSDRHQVLRAVVPGRSVCDSRLLTNAQPLR
jgi:hypothetical protein